MQDILVKYIPTNAVEAIFQLIKEYGVHLKIVNERKTRHGDYRKMPDGRLQITVNGSLNNYRFLITLVHEIAHLKAFKEYGFQIKPHGKEWKRTFTYLILPFINPTIFPQDLLPFLARHFKNPKASSDTDAQLAIKLKTYDTPNNKNYIFELPLGSIFKIYNGKIFKKGSKRVKRFECVEMNTGKVYLFQPNAEVEFVKDNT